MQFKIGDLVYPKTRAGLELAHVPCNGERNQKRDVTCVLRGVGKIIGTCATTIDYSTWGDIYAELFSGPIPCISYLVECEESSGWGGESALVTSPEDQLPKK